MRTSGTEPKVKLYVEVIDGEQSKAKAELDALVAVISKDLMLPDTFNLIAK